MVSSVSHAVGREEAEKLSPPYLSSTLCCQDTKWSQKIPHGTWEWEIRVRDDDKEELRVSVPPPSLALLSTDRPANRRPTPLPPRRRLGWAAALWRSFFPASSLCLLSGKQFSHIPPEVKKPRCSVKCDSPKRNVSVNDRSLDGRD